jgi:hypothetical protein
MALFTKPGSVLHAFTPIGPETPDPRECEDCPGHQDSPEGEPQRPQERTDGLSQREAGFNPPEVLRLGDGERSRVFFGDGTA